ncbi:long-chain-fatty-acid--CoA ligase [Blastomonas aquatica]|uniref:Acyl-CoA synthetase n=1 Tax=Blastomonas aquatica TaxID=1510276 RepID=A0ABQ1IWZ4_9SPHN|nr:long-chain-fatty-acid--CoA ligase [Blastomonas aquatica]GGB53278.1 acyl-CoA synthetase [Blastomonas aquatica]
MSMIADMVARGATATPDKTALIQDDEALSYAKLDDLVCRSVAALRASGIGKGDRVAFLGLNSIDYVILLIAALRIGAVTVAVNWRLVPREIAYIVKDAGARLLLTQRAVLDNALAVRDEAGLETILLGDGVFEGRPAFRAWVQGFAPDRSLADLADGDVAVQLYTSGTTGHPKGALLTHGSLAASLSQGKKIGEDWAAWLPSDVSLVAMPLFHIGGTAWVMQTLNGGGTGVILAQPDVALIIAAVQRHGITKMFAVPAVLNMVLNHPDAVGADFSSMRVLPYGASPIPLDVLSRSMRMFPNAQFVQMYGATETSGTIVYLPPEDHDVAGTPRMAGCGKPFPDVKLRIVGEDGEDRAVGEVGEVWVRAPLVMAGYHNLADANASAFVDGWYRTGDAAYVDADGYLYLFDRVKDMIVSGGENIYPAEVENALHHHPAVRDCAVIGVPDARWGEAVKAIVVLKPDETAEESGLIAFAREHIAGFKCPKSVDFVDELPRNPSGKVLKKELRKLYWQEGARQIG